MLAFPSMLISAAEQAGIPVPPEDLIDDADLNSFRDTHPQFFVLCMTQLSRAMTPGEQFENAKALAKIPVDKLITMTALEIHEAGCRCWI